MRRKRWQWHWGIRDSDGEKVYPPQKPSVPLLLDIHGGSHESEREVSRVTIKIEALIQLVVKSNSFVRVTVREVQEQFQQQRHFRDNVERREEDRDILRSQK